MTSPRLRRWMIPALAAAALGFAVLPAAAETIAAGSAGPLTLGAGGRLTWIFLAAQNRWFGQF